MSARESRPAGTRAATRPNCKEESRRTTSASIIPDAAGFSPEHEARLQGFSEGWQARQNEIDRLNTIADYWWLRANNTPAQIREIEAKRMDAAFVEIEREFFGGAQ